jgi:glycyl-tRNA synthetase
MVLEGKYEKLQDLAKRRGLFWGSYEIYGGVGGFMDIGPLGVQLKHRIEEAWRDFFIKRHGLFEIETPITAPSRVFEASGHLESFKDPMVQCKACGRKFRADHIVKEYLKISGTEAERLSLQEIERVISDEKIPCPECGGELMKPTLFLTMFQTTIGPYSEAIGYLRPEAAQGMFTSFKRVFEQARGKLPIGIAQIGRVARNEISPRQGLIRLREFTIMEFEFFFDPDDPVCPWLSEVYDETLRLITEPLRLKGSEEPMELSVKEILERKLIKVDWLVYFMALAKKFLLKLGVPGEAQRFIEKLPWERAHYSAQGFDQEVYLDRLGWVEVSGHNYRTDYDLRRHMEFSGQDMRVFKAYESPKVVDNLTLKLDRANLGKTFKADAPLIASRLERMDPEFVKRSFEEKGYVDVEGFRILPEHVQIVRESRVERGKRFIPHVIEPSFGCERLLYATLEFAYMEREGRAILRLPKGLAPIEIAVFPLMAKDPLCEKARKIYHWLLERGFNADYDEAGSIGKRYVRADEMGIPLAATVDYQTLEDGTVTLRDRDTWRQVRVLLEAMEDRIRGFLEGKLSFEELGPSFGT